MWSQIKVFSLSFIGPLNKVKLPNSTNSIKNIKNKLINWKSDIVSDNCCIPEALIHCYISNEKCNKEKHSNYLNFV